MIASTLERSAGYRSVSLHPRAIKTRARGVAGAKKGPFHKPLPTRFRRDGFDYRQIARKEDAALYEQTWSGCSNPSVGYEVIRIRHRQGFQIGGRFVGPAEVYPNSEAWGVDAFTLTERRGICKAKGGGR